MAARWGSRLVGAPAKGWIRALPPPLNAWTRSRDFPSFAPKPFHAMFAERAKQKKEN
jgi:L-lactate dehydrogenase complex protein LldF